MDDGGAIDLHHVQQALGIDLREFTILAEAGIVDQKLDGDPFLLSERSDFLRRCGLG
jgi:hypothetical protein